MLNNRLRSAAKDPLPPLLYRAIRSPKASSFGRNYEAAEQAGRSVYDYVQHIWRTEGHTARLIQWLLTFGAISEAIKHVVEIGPGTGRHEDHILRRHKPNRYLTYEAGQDRNEWLAAHYRVEACRADGLTVAQANTEAVDMIRANSVFNYIPFLPSCSYFRGILRATHRSGFVACDIDSEPYITDEIIDR